MKVFTASGFIAAAAIVLGGLGAASAAHARSDVFFSIGVQSPQPVYVQPQPVYVQPRQVYVQPAPAYYPPQTVYVQPSPVYVQPAPYGYYYDNGRDWRRVEWERRQYWQRQHHGWDRDRDGLRD
jgi:hypothetical protein